MKKFILALAFILIAVPAFAQSADDGDVSAIRVIPDAVAMRLDAVKIEFRKKRAVIVYKEVDADGNDTGVSNRKVFINIDDNPDTVDVDETNRAFNKAIRDIIDTAVVADTAGDNARKALKKGVKEAYTAE